MSIIGKIFSGGAGELVESVGGVLDNLTTSKEEKLAAKHKMKEGGNLLASLRLNKHDT